jgi:hypothetical protein
MPAATKRPPMKAVPATFIKYSPKLENDEVGLPSNETAGLHEH